MSNASRGHALERRARDELEAAGYAVGRVRGSLGPTDLIALPLFPLTGRPLLVQVKGGPLPRLDPDEWNVLWLLARNANAIALLATKPKPSARMTWQTLTAPKTIRGGRSPLKPFHLAPIARGDVDDLVATVSDEYPGGIR